jgi:nucleotide-binding universal stress UspA family protein
MKRILVATDGSDGADRAVDYAAHLAKENGAELLIVNVISDAFPGDLFARITEVQQSWLKELFASESAKILTKARDRAWHVGSRTVELDSRIGDIAQTVLEIARDKGVEAIVVGKCGGGRLAGLLLGSISQKLVSLAPLPVIVIP